MVGETPESIARANPQGDAVYVAEELAATDSGTADDRIAADDLGQWVSETMRRAGWSGGGVPAFRLDLDVADDSDVAGSCEADRGVIHLAPDALDRWTVLHEVAHWLRPRDGHGPQFCETLLGLVAAGLGEDVAVWLDHEFQQAGIEVDRVWGPWPSEGER